MSVLTQVGLLFRRYWLSTIREPMWLIMGFASPILYLALFTPLLQHFESRGTALDGFLPGILAFVAFGGGMSPGFSTVFDLGQGVVERLRVTPVSRLAILLGPILSTVSLTVLVNAMLVAVGAVFGFSVHWAGLALLVLLLAILEATAAAFFVTVALKTGRINSFAAVANGLNLPVLLLAGVLLPISFGPLWLRILAHINPLYYAVAASRVLGAGDITGAAVWQGFAVLVPLCAVSLAWASSVLRHAVS